MTSRQKLRSDLQSLLAEIDLAVTKNETITPLRVRVWRTKLTILYRHYLNLSNALADYQVSWILKQKGVRYD